MCYLQSLIDIFLGLDVAGCGMWVLDTELRTLALCKRLHICTTNFILLDGVFGVSSVVECGYKKTHPGWGGFSLKGH